MTPLLVRAYRRVWEHYLEFLWSFPGVVDVHFDGTVIRVWIDSAVITTITLPPVLVYQGVGVPLERCVWTYPQLEDLVLSSNPTTP
jgi:hypothetical protein